jgi:hypothetical protein
MRIGWLVREPFRKGDVVTKWHSAYIVSRLTPVLTLVEQSKTRNGHGSGTQIDEMVLIYQPPNAHVRISWILLSNTMAAAAVKKIY